MARRPVKETAVALAAPQIVKETPSDQPSQSTEAKLPTVQSPYYRTVYVNHGKIPVSQWDIGLVFGHVAERQDIGTVVEEQIAIKMSPPYFKALLSSLNAALESWENTFGVIELGLGQRPNSQGVSDMFTKLAGILKTNEKAN